MVVDVFTESHYRAYQYLGALVPAPPPLEAKICIFFSVKKFYAKI